MACCLCCDNVISCVPMQLGEFGFFNLKEDITQCSAVPFPQGF